MVRQQLTDQIKNLSGSKYFFRFLEPGVNNGRFISLLIKDSHVLKAKSRGSRSTHLYVIHESQNRTQSAYHFRQKMVCLHST